MAGLHAPGLAEGGEHAPYLMTSLGPNSVTAENIGPEQVGSEEIVAGSVGPAKVTLASDPVASGEEGKMVLGPVGVSRKVVVALTGNGILTKFVIKHGLGTKFVQTSILSSALEEPITTLAKAIALSVSELEVVFTLALGAKAVAYVVLVG